MTNPGVPASPGFPPLDAAAQSAIRAAQERLDVLTRPRVPLPQLAQEEKDQALETAASTACVLCGAIHPGAGTPACPRLATFEVNGDGNVVKGSFWAHTAWDRDWVVWPADLAEKDDDGASAQPAVDIPAAMREAGAVHPVPIRGDVYRWTDVFPGLQCRAAQYSTSGGPVLEFRLTPREDRDA